MCVCVCVCLWRRACLPDGRADDMSCQTRAKVRMFVRKFINRCVVVARMATIARA